MHGQLIRFKRHPMRHAGWVAAGLGLLFLMGLGLFTPVFDRLWPGMHLGTAAVVIGCLGLVYIPMLVAKASDWRKRHGERRRETGVGDDGSGVVGLRRPTIR